MNTTVKKFHPHWLLTLLFIGLVAILRIPNAAQLTPWANFSPIGAMGLFGGAYFARRYQAVLLPLICMFLSDFAINLIVFNGKYGMMYDGWYIIYGVIALIALMGHWLLKRVTVINVLGAGLMASLLHWLVADFSVWAAGGTDLRTLQPLTRDMNGLLQCYVQGLPYFKHFLLGTLAYSAVLFGVMSWIRSRYFSFYTTQPTTLYGREEQA